MEESNQRFLHRIVAADSYYGVSSGRFATVMIEADESFFGAENLKEKIGLVSLRRY